MSEQLPLSSRTEDHALLTDLRKRRPSRRAMHKEDLSIGERLADKVAEMVGSWRFIIAQAALLILWIILNAIAWFYQWDPYPFILLNLVLSFQAAFTAPVLMMSQNRQSDIDRRKAENDYEINLKAELEIEQLHQKIDQMREKEIMELIHIVHELTHRLDEKPPR